MKKIQYKSGDIINGLKFIKELEPHISPSRNMRKAIFECYCGKKFETIIRSVISGNTKSCGCFGYKSRSIRFTKHGQRNHELYSTWCCIKTRCYNKKRSDFKFYGGRGIVMSDEFKSNFIIWLNYVIALPDYKNRVKNNLTLDRINAKGNYERGNLRWATKKEQSNNRYNG